MKLRDLSIAQTYFQDPVANYFYKFLKGGKDLKRNIFVKKALKKSKGVGGKLKQEVSLFPQLISVDELIYDKKSDVDNLVDNNDGSLKKSNNHDTKSIDQDV